MSNSDNLNKQDKFIAELKKVEKKISVINDTFEKINNEYRGGSETAVNRIVQILKRANRIGTLHLILAILLFTIGLAFISIEVYIKRNDSKEFDEQNQYFLSSVQEARRDIEKYGTLAAVLAPLNDPKRLKKSEITSKESDSLSNYFNSLTRNLTIDKDEFPYVEPISTISAKESFALGPPVILKSKSRSNWNVLIPQTEYSCDHKDIANLFSELKKKIPKKSNRPNAIIKLIKSDSSSHCILENTWKSILYSTIVAKLDFDSSLIAKYKQVFFVSFDGIFSHIINPGSNESLLDVAENSPMYKWEASSYVQYFLDPKADTKYQSKAYLDIAGLGIVNTISFLLKDDSNKIIGIICLDKQIEIKEYLEKFQTTNTSEFYNSWNYGSFNYHLLKIDHTASHENDSLKSILKNSGIRSEIEKDALRFIDSLEKNGNISPGVKLVKPATKKIYKITLRSEQGKSSILYVTTIEKSIFNEIGARLILGFGLILLSFGFLFYAATKVISNNEKAGLANIIRNLPIGVLELETNSNKEKGDWIKFGNDYAEEILGEPLVRFGESRIGYQNQEKGFNDFFDVKNALYILNEETNLIERMHFHKIEDKRKKEGVTNSYFTRLKKTRMSKEEDGDRNIWVEVTGSPIFRQFSDSPIELTPTFGVFRQIKDPNICQLLDKKYTDKNSNGN